MIRKSVSYLIIIFALTALLEGCKIAEIPALPSSIAPPASYHGNSNDTTSMATINWKSFFADTFLVKLIDTALLHNPDMQTALQRIEIARAKMRFREGAMLPTLGAEASAGVRRYSDYSLDGVGNYDTNLSDNVTGNRRIPNPTPDFFLGLRSSWEIDLWGKLKSRKKAAYARLLASEKGVHLVKTTLVAEVAGLYFQLLALDNELEVIRENVKLQETALEIITLQKMGGKTTELAVKQFNAQLLNTKSMEARIRQRITQTENQLNLLLGRMPQTIERGKPINEQQLPEEVNAGIPGDLLLNRPDIRQAELELLAAKADVKAARAAFYPSFTISPFVGLHSFRAAMLFDAPSSLAMGILGGLTAPLLNRYQIESDFKQSVAANKVEFYNYQKAILAGYNEVFTSLNRIENLEKVAELKEQEVEVLTQAVAVSNDLFLGGYASYLEVITAQKRVLEAQLELTNTRKEQFLSIIDLYRELGGGWQ